MTDGEKRILYALSLMCEQYLERGGELQHLFMSAGEQAVEVLARYGLVDLAPSGGVWTAAGRALLDDDWLRYP